MKETKENTFSSFHAVENFFDASAKKSVLIIIISISFLLLFNIEIILINRIVIIRK